MKFRYKLTKHNEINKIKIQIMHYSIEKLFLPFLSDADSFPANKLVNKLNDILNEYIYLREQMTHFQKTLI